MGATTTAEVGAAPRFHLHPEVEAMPRERLAALQGERLRAAVRSAYANVPLHRARLDAAGVEPEAIRTAADVRLLPFTPSR